MSYKTVLWVTRNDMVTGALQRHIDSSLPMAKNVVMIYGGHVPCIQVDKIVIVDCADLRNEQWEHDYLSVRFGPEGGEIKHV